MLVSGVSRDVCGRGWALRLLLGDGDRGGEGVSSSGSVGMANVFAGVPVMVGWLDMLLVRPVLLVFVAMDGMVMDTIAGVLEGWSSWVLLVVCSGLLSTVWDSGSGC